MGQSGVPLTEFAEFSLHRILLFKKLFDLTLWAKKNLTGREKYVHSVSFSYTYQTEEDNNKKGLQVEDEMITEKDMMVKILNF